jgi:uncharacterized coiled-coil DUF342 family protein
MKLTKLGLENVQGMTGNFHFKDVTVITGGNGSGKTTLVKAIRFALAGELPVLGKSGRSTWRMASDQTKDGKMQIGLQTDTGLHVTHSWDRKDGKVSYNASIPAEVKWPAAMLDFRTFLSMRAADQAEALFNLCPNKAGKGDAISKILEVTTFNPDVSNAVLDQLSTELQAIAPKAKLQEWLAESITHIANKAKTAKQESDGAAASLRSHQASRPESVKDPTKELDEATKERDKLTASIAKITRAWREYEREQAVYDNKLATHQTALKALQQRVTTYRSDEERNAQKAKDATKCPHCGSDGDQFKESKAKTIAAIHSDADINVQFTNGEIDKTQKEIDALVKPKKPSETATAVTRQINDLNVRITELQTQKAAFDAASTWATRRDELEREAARKAITYEVLSKAGKVLAAWREEQIADGIKKALKVANRITEPFGMTIEWHSELGEFGRYRDKSWVSLDTFSGSEEQIAFAGLAATVCAKTPLRIIIMDEMGRFTSDRKKQVCDVMAQMIKDGIIDQFIGVDVKGGLNPRAIASVNACIEID